jgi:hypothetical protein
MIPILARFCALLIGKGVTELAPGRRALGPAAAALACATLLLALGLPPSPRLPDPPDVEPLPPPAKAWADRDVYLGWASIPEWELRLRPSAEPRPRRRRIALRRPASPALAKPLELPAAGPHGAAPLAPAAERTPRGYSAEVAVAGLPALPPETGGAPDLAAAPRSLFGTPLRRSLAAASAAGDDRGGDEPAPPDEGTGPSAADPAAPRQTAATPVSAPAAPSAPGRVERGPDAPRPAPVPGRTLRPSPEATPPPGPPFEGPRRAPRATTDGPGSAPPASPPRAGPEVAAGPRQSGRPVEQEDAPPAEPARSAAPPLAGTTPSGPDILLDLADDGVPVPPLPQLAGHPAGPPLPPEERANDDQAPPSVALALGRGGKGSEAEPPVFASPGIALVPEPASALLVGCGLAALGVARRRAGR